MNSRCPIQSCLRAAALAGVFVVATFPAAAPSALAQTGAGGGGNPFDGVWSLVLDIGYYSVTSPIVTATTAISNAANVPAGVEPWADLKPTRVTKEELAPDVIRQTTTYEATRQTNNMGADAASVPPTTQRIEIKHVRYLNLVPRG